MKATYSNKDTKREKKNTNSRSPPTEELCLKKKRYSVSSNNYKIIIIIIKHTMKRVHFTENISKKKLRACQKHLLEVSPKKK